MDNNIQDRIQTIMNECFNGVAKQFGEHIGRNMNTFKDIVAGKRTAPSYALIYDILSSDLGINPEWLILGEGPMMKTKNDSVSPANLKFENQITNVFITNWSDIKDVVKEAIRETSK